MDRVIDMTEEEVLAANMKALGLPPDSIALAQPMADLALAAMEKAVRKHRRLVGTEEIMAEGFPYSRTSLRDQLIRLRSDGRAFARPDPRKSDRWVYMPRVV